MSFVRHAGACVVLGLLTTTAVADPVRTDKGLVSGQVKDGIRAWKGIPYAAPPVGELRWRAPQPAAAWTGTRAGDRFAHDCMQEPYPADAAPLRDTPAEDCLYLNVWAPEKARATKLPVMVWIHGGGFVNGGSSPAVYDGAAFARRGIVFVSFNYRLGRFGFFAHPALTHETPKGPLGNYAYLDQIAVLQWVQRNAAAFGGDPGNVTLFGESAGGASVNAMMTSPLAKGLFQKAIVHSGGGRVGPLGVRQFRGASTNGQPSGEAIGLAFARLAGVTGEGPDALAALRKLPAEQIVRGLNLATMGAQGDTWVGGPMLDGTILVEDAEAAFRAGRQAHVPYLVGANSREFGMLAPLPPVAAEGTLARFGPERDTVVAAYDPDGKAGVPEVAIGVIGDSLMGEPARMLARLAAASGAPTWAYRFSYVASSLRTQTSGAIHATEIPYVFDTVRARYGAATTLEDEAAAAAANAYWAAFARTGDPNGEGRPKWPAYTAATDVLMDFTLTGPLAGPDTRKARLDIIERAASTPTQ